MVKCTGLGNVRHIDVQEFWVHQAFKDHRFILHAVNGSENPADT